jgi:signal transduction histidine kinase
MRSHFNLTQKFIGFLLLTSVLPLLAVGGISYQVSRTILQSEATKYTAELVENQSDYLELQLKQIESLAINIAGVDDIIQGLEAPESEHNTYTHLATQARIGYILNSYIGLDGLVSIDLLTLQGKHYHVGDTLDISEIRSDVKHRILLQALEDDRQVTWIGIEDNVNVNSQYLKVLTAAKLLHRTNSTTLQSEPVAVLVVNYSIEALYQYFQQINLGPGAYLMIVDSQQRLIYHPDQALLGAKVNPDLLQRLQTKSASQLQTIDHQRMLITHIQSDLNGWIVMSAVPMQTLMAPARAIGITTLLALAVAFIIILAVAWVVSDQVVQPLREITRRFQLFQQRQPGWQTPLTVVGQDEISELSTWFNAFLGSLAAQQRAERALRQSKEAAEAANRAKSTFLSHINHELRTPLNAILGGVQVLASDPETSSTQRDTLTLINKSGEHLLELVNNVLDLSKIEAGQLSVSLQTVDLIELLDSLVSLFQAQAAAKQLRFLYIPSPVMPRYIRTDAGKLRQILTNLLDNAIKFTTRGQVALRVSAIFEEKNGEGGEAGVKNQDAAPVYQANARQTKPQNSIMSLGFCVDDSGPGLSPTELETIFQPFVQASSGQNLNQGTGLGLAISDRLAQLLQGKIHVQSTLTVGTQFTLQLPVQVVSATAEPSTPIRSDILGLAPGQPPVRLLIVDDVSSNRHVMGRLLASVGFEIQMATNGQEAIDLWEQWQPHLIFMDMKMPVMDGYEATHQIRSKQRQALAPWSQANDTFAPGTSISCLERAVLNPVIIALTANALTEERQRILAAGFDDFMGKPIRRDGMLHTIQQYLGVVYQYSRC